MHLTQTKTFLILWSFLARLILFIGCLAYVPQVSAERYALVIGNADYAFDRLKNPGNDADDMAAVLKDVGFEVTKLKNADKRRMQDAIRVFTGQLHRQNAVGLFFYAGHGIEVAGRNYMIPIGAAIESEPDVEFEAIDAGRVLKAMQHAGNGLNMVILDACRNNPFARSFRSASRGLAPMDPPKGVLVLYATSPGDVAADGTGRNGLFTRHLLRAINSPGLKVEEVFKSTALEVFKETDEKQLPWQEGVLLGDFYFTINATVTPSSSANNAVQTEILYWDSIKHEADPKYFTAYLNKYPNGQFAELAKLKSRATEIEKIDLPKVEQQNLIAGRYRDNGDGTVTDMTTGLQWMRCSLGQTWQNKTCVGQASLYNYGDAADRVFAGHNDWRVPSINELITLIYCSSGSPKTWNDTGNFCQGDYQIPAINQHAFPNTPTSFVWSSSPSASYAGGAWGVYFSSGSVYGSGETYGGPIRLVRGGQ